MMAWLRALFLPPKLPLDIDADRLRAENRQANQRAAEEARRLRRIVHENNRRLADDFEEMARRIRER